ncbi:MAG TPA: hypothetical protein VFF41_03095 [Gallionella sp.]|nr:hypothetical protein [Gallionella sp.]
MKQQFYDLKFEQLPEGAVRLEQRDNGDATVINAHPAQLIHIARSLVGAKVSPEVQRTKTLERRLRWLYDRFLECYKVLPPDELFERYANAQEFYTWLEASIDVAAEYCADLTP